MGTMMKRIFLIVLDSVGIGEMPDAALYGDEGSNTLAAAATSSKFDMPNMKKLGLFNIDGINIKEREQNPTATFARMTEQSKGKDTTIGHWEIAGIISEKPLPTYPDGFPEEIIQALEKETGRSIICNKPYSGTDVIRDYGAKHVESGALIVYTSADSVLQIAAHEDIVPIETLYEYCRIARQICTGEHSVGRVIARPFVGEEGSFVRTSHRHDYSLTPPAITMLDQLTENNIDVISVGKISDIFAGKGIKESHPIASNLEGMNKTLEIMNKEFEGLCFVNLVDYDMLYGHRNDIEGYAKALTEFDQYLPKLLDALKEDDILMITADHGCDPSTPSTDHSREYTPLVITGNSIKEGINLGTRNSFADIAASILEYFNIEQKTKGDSFLKQISKNES